MERPKFNIPKEQQNIFDHILTGAFGNPIIFSEAPTSDTMKNNTWGLHSTNLYIKFASGVCLRIGGTSI